MMRIRIVNRCVPFLDWSNQPSFKYHRLRMPLILVTVLVRVLEFMFVVGWAGSAIVLLLTGFEDLETLMDREDENSH